MKCSPTHKHGANRTCYTKHGCDCRACRAANREYQQRERLMRGCDVRVPALGAQRRLQALAVMGWSTRDVAEATGLHEVFIARVRRGAKANIAASTHSLVEDAFRRLAMRRNTTRDGLVTSGWATRVGWAGPLAWDDIDKPRERAKR